MLIWGAFICTSKIEFAFLWLDKMTFDGLWQFRSIESRWFFVFQIGSLISLCVPFLVAHRLVAEHWVDKFGSSDKVDLALRLAYSSSVSVSHFRRLNKNLQWYFWQSYFWQSHFWRHRTDAYAVAFRQIRIFAADEYKARIWLASWLMIAKWGVRTCHTSWFIFKPWSYSNCFESTFFFKGWLRWGVKEL